MWTFTMDRDGHLTIRNRGRVVWEGSFEAFMADGDVQPPADLVDRIHDRHGAIFGYGRLFDGE